MNKKNCFILVLLLLAFTASCFAYYDPHTHAFISRDPIREDGGINLYAYCGDNPVGNYDPIGCGPLDDAQSRLNYAIDHGVEAEIEAAEQSMTILPGDPRVSPLNLPQRAVGVALGASLLGPSDADMALSPAQPIGSGFGHQASLYGWSLYNSAVGFVSMGSNLSRILTGQQSISARAINEEYLQRFTYGERSAADFNTFGASLFAPLAAEKVGDVAEGAVGVLRNLNFGNDAVAGQGMLRPNPFASERGSVINPFAELFGEGPESNAINITTPYRGGFARPPRHHIFPQAERGWFAVRGIDIDQYTVQMSEPFHQALHGGGNWKLGKLSPDEWGSRIMRELTFAESAKGSPLTPPEIMSVTEGLLDEYGMRNVEFVPFR
jgi:hypothetical protein